MSAGIVRSRAMVSLALAMTARNYTPTSTKLCRVRGLFHRGLPLRLDVELCRRGPSPRQWSSGSCVVFLRASSRSSRRARASNSSAYGWSSPHQQRRPQNRLKDFTPTVRGGPRASARAHARRQPAARLRVPGHGAHPLHPDHHAGPTATVAAMPVDEAALQVLQEVCLPQAARPPSEAPCKRARAPPAASLRSHVPDREVRSREWPPKVRTRGELCGFCGVQCSGRALPKLAVIWQLSTKTGQIGPGSGQAWQNLARIHKRRRMSAGSCGVCKRAWSLVLLTESVEPMSS